VLRGMPAASSSSLMVNVCILEDDATRRTRPQAGGSREPLE
jgi:hypothetical protein